MDTIAVFKPRNYAFRSFVDLLGDLANTIRYCEFASAVRVRTTKEIEPRTMQLKIESSSASFDMKNLFCKGHFLVEKRDGTEPHQAIDGITCFHCLREYGFRRKGREDRDVLRNFGGRREHHAKRAVDPQ